MTACVYVNWYDGVKYGDRQVELMMRIDSCKLNIKVEFVRGNVTEYVVPVSKTALRAAELEKLTEEEAVDELLIRLANLFPVDEGTEEGQEEYLIAWEIFRF